VDGAASPCDAAGRPASDLAGADARRKRHETRAWLDSLPAGASLQGEDAYHLRADAQLWRSLRAHLEAVREAVEWAIEHDPESDRDRILARPFLDALRLIAELPSPEHWVACVECRDGVPEGGSSSPCAACGDARYAIPWSAE
jgi:hypothetical protein